jgi:carbon monoxide dehydrogenase subunit G
MTYGADVSDELHVILAGDSEGRLHVIDPRDHNVCARGGDGSDAAAAAAGSAAAVQAHKPGTKVNWVAVHPAGGSRIVATAGAATAKSSDDQH